MIEIILILCWSSSEGISNVHFTSWSPNERPILYEMGAHLAYLIGHFGSDRNNETLTSRRSRSSLFCIYRKPRWMSHRHAFISHDTTSIISLPPAWEEAFGVLYEVYSLLDLGSGGR